MNDELVAYVRLKLGDIPDGVSLETIDGSRATALLWLLNEALRPHVAKLRSIRYDAAFEGEADDAILRFAEVGAGGWTQCSAGCWRVLLERQRQALLLAAANEHARNPVMSLPVGLSEDELRVALVLFSQLRMKLPWPPSAAADIGFLGGPPPTLDRH